MNSRERFVSALRRGKPDITPFFDQLYHRELYDRILGVVPDRFSLIDACRLSDALDLDAALIIYGRYPAFNLEDDTSRWRSEWGVTYSVEGGGWPTGFGVDYELHDIKSLAAHKTPDPDDPHRWEATAEACSFLRERDRAIVGGVRGPFAMLAWHLLGMETTMIAVLDDVVLLTKALSEYTSHATGIIREWARHGADAIFMTEDLGSSHGPLLSPDQYESIFLGSLESMVSAAKSSGMEVIIHSDGMVLPFFELFRRAGVSAVHPIERSAGMSLSYCKEHWGETFAFCGNADTKGVLRTGTPEQVREEVRAVMAEGDPGGGYIFTTDHSIHEGLPIENVLAMIDEVRSVR